ncbi:hypothetical protein FIBSPDRAFT_855387 [Athelia psychrophila]|uniref:Uncharacterized protein n=1 Tax=Athelia psychrophila TaxID=1759441 RepID=A0A166PGX7_9AGAM|nr:hypothetical protein FIBSPDRAFT_855387 [Fibularhizoctonia sp. CBS 109695]
MKPHVIVKLRVIITIYIQRIVLLSTPEYAHFRTHAQPTAVYSPPVHFAAILGLRLCWNSVEFAAGVECCDRCLGYQHKCMQKSVHKPGPSKLFLQAARRVCTDLPSPPASASAGPRSPASRVPSPHSTAADPPGSTSTRFGCYPRPISKH